MSRNGLWLVRRWLQRRVVDIGKGAMERRKWEERRRYTGRVGKQPGLAPSLLPCSVP